MSTTGNTLPPAATPLTATTMRRRAVWTVVLVLAALGGAGLATAADRPPTDAQRPELTWRADQRAAPTLVAMRAELAGLATRVDALADAGRGALSGLAALDADALEAAVADGDAAVTTVAVRLDELAALRAAQQAEVADDRLSQASREALARVDEVVDEVSEALNAWPGMAARALVAAQLLQALEDHDGLVLEAAAAGRDAEWSDALALLESAEERLAAARAARDALAGEGDVQTLDELLDRYATFDVALAELYAEFERTGNDEAPETDELRAEVEQARAALPQTTHALQVALSDAAGDRLARGVVAIERARGAVGAARSALGGE